MFIYSFEESLLNANNLNLLGSCRISLDVNESQLCKLILNCPFMLDLYIWLQWEDFFRPKYGTFKSFVIKHEREFKDLLLFETSIGEMIRLPVDTNCDSFERELNAMHIRSAAGHLCSSIIQGGLITQFPINVYQTTMNTWFCLLRSLAIVRDDNVDPIKYILEFLMYLPILIGQSRIIEQLVLQPLDKVFDDVSDGTINARTRLWNLADVNQRRKLELWGHTINVNEWKNEKKWLGHIEDLEENSTVQLGSECIEKEKTGKGMLF